MKGVWSKVVIRCMTRRARVRGSPCIVTIVKRPWGSQRDTRVKVISRTESETLMFVFLLFRESCSA